MDDHLHHFHYHNCLPDLVEAVEPFKLHPTSILYKFKVFEHLLLWWMGICMHTYLVTTTSVAPDLGELLEIVSDVCSNDATLPFKLHPTSISYAYCFFEHLLPCYMGICMHIYTVTILSVALHLGELFEIVGDVNVQMMPLRYG